MGFKSAQELRDGGFSLSVYCDRVRAVNEGHTPGWYGYLPVDNGRTFFADSIRNYTIDDIMANFNGKEREPNVADWEKKYKIMTIVMSRVDTVGQTTIKDRAKTVVEHINWFAGKETPENSDGMYNFYQATDKRGSIEAAGLNNSLKSDFDDSRPDPNPAPLPKPKPKPANVSILPVTLFLTEGYADTSFNIIVSNTGGEKLSFTEIKISGDDFVITSGGTNANAYAVNKGWKFAPVTGLSAGTYTETISLISNDSEISTAELKLIVFAESEGNPKPASLTVPEINLSFPENYTDSNVLITIINEGEMQAFLKEYEGVNISSANENFTVMYMSGAEIISSGYENKTWVMEIKSGLAKGNYTATIEVLYDNGKKAEGIVKLLVDDGATDIKLEIEKNKYFGIIFLKNPASDKAEILVKSPEKLKYSELFIYDMLGNAVFKEESVNGTEDNGFVWDLRNSAGRKVAGGTYLVIVEATSVSGSKYRYSAKLGVK